MVELQRRYFVAGSLDRACTQNRTEIRNPEHWTGHRVS
jgi:hypothetical protein